MTSDDELAAVIGHEIGHVEKRHTVHQLEKQMALSFLSILAGAAAGDPGAGIALATTASQALMAGYSRADEREADQEGFRMCNEAGYNPYGIYVTMAKLDDMSKEMGNPGYGLFSSHPEPEVRMAKALQWVKPLHIGAAVTVNAEGSATVSQNGWSYTITETAGYDKPGLPGLSDGRSPVPVPEAGALMSPIFSPWTGTTGPMCIMKISASSGCIPRITSRMAGLGNWPGRLPESSRTGPGR